MTAEDDRSDPNVNEIDLLFGLSGLQIDAVDREALIQMYGRLAAQRRLMLDADRGETEPATIFSPTALEGESDED